MRSFGIVILLALMSVLAGCATNPATGKTDFVMMSEQEELGMGQKYSQEILKQYPRYEDAKLQSYVQQVGERVARAGDRPNLQYHFTVIDTPDINAFALPGGYIYIHRGLMAYLGSEAELAAVLGHEVGHVTARHSVRQQSQSSAWNILGQAVAIGTGVNAAADLTNVLGTAFVRGYGRDMELEADGLGAKYLARAGYDPTAMIQVVRVLKNQEDFARDEAARKGQATQPVGYHGLFDTHPDNDQRLKQVVGPAQALAGGQQELGVERYLKAIDGMPFGDSAASGVRRGQNFYHSELDFTLSYPTGWGILNQPAALVGFTADQQAYIGMKLVQRDGQLTPAEYLRKGTGGRLAAEESFQQAGLTGATGVVPGSPARRIAVIYQKDRAYLFVGAVKGRASLESVDDQFMQVIRSFRPMRADERKLAEPRRIAVVQVKSGQTVEQFANAESGPQSDSINRIRLLNDLYPTGEPKPGDWLKVVR
ncbi:M48 family metalloprotease [Pseudomonas sp. ZM23]|uniref:M48 family metalloprotease n=2 Tax=Pseudomonas triclosanedens TaxID=2961893 RepID=A0ABY7A665_9PSED|nr:M48 family metalloprotease [Pseudomonas triclosanedens]MCP8462984.1 M48 family metalloprotease [Pseudomonas triclosanedens]MCP8468604.1 M48 family metalloprotease [Pseudomonas triclosanedens]MCP8475326.1 M48 family metalloprotease [Pseudomonas triclosanedens]WAI52402.1 M48 family metalloprotease [Pseudomonas triclosanedens]